MKIRLYTLTWNEELLIRHFIKYYEKFCDSIVVYDNKSTDTTRSIVEQFNKVEVREFDNGDKIREDLVIRLKNHVWKECRGTDIDYVIVADADEFLWHRDLKSFLRTYRKFSVFKPQGFQMVSNKFPPQNSNLFEQVRRGCRRSEFSKCVLFSPNRVQEINYHPGSHKCRPSGDIKMWESSNELKLLHFRWLDINYVRERYSNYRKRQSLINKLMRWSTHYAANEHKLDGIYKYLLENSEDVF